MFRRKTWYRYLPRPPELLLDWSTKTGSVCFASHRCHAVLLGVPSILMLYGLGARIAVELGGLKMVKNGFWHDVRKKIALTNLFRIHPNNIQYVRSIARG